MDFLSVDAPVKLRCGGEQKYTDKEGMKDKRICGDFYFRFMNLYKSLGVLFGKDSTNGKPAVVTNPDASFGMCKHILTAVSRLISTGFLGVGSPLEKADDTKMFSGIF
jgi:hypothetical protein